MKRKVAWASGALALLLLAIQLVPVDRHNPAVESEIPATPEVRTILRRACYDCHSNETVWPWYSGIAPISWLISQDVHEGREKLNLSTWNRLREEERDKAREKAWKAVAEGEMPPWYYVPIHSHAHLSQQDKALLREWLQGDKRAAVALVKSVTVLGITVRDLSMIEKGFGSVSSG